MTTPVDAPTLDAAAATRLAAWLSPAFPTGAYSYSHGLERAVELGWIDDADSLCAWLDGVLRHGAGRLDAVLMANAWRRAAQMPWLREVWELACALRPTSELALETESQGRAFLDTVREVWPSPLLDALHDHALRWDLPVPLPIAVGVACRAHDLPLRPALALHLHAFVANLVSAGVRLVPLGQTDGQRVTARLEALALAVATEAAQCGLEGVATATPMLEVVSMQHETQYTRLFRS